MNIAHSNQAYASQCRPSAAALAVTGGICFGAWALSAIWTWQCKEILNIVGLSFPPLSVMLIDRSAHLFACEGFGSWLRLDASHLLVVRVYRESLSVKRLSTGRNPIDEVQPLDDPGSFEADPVHN